jgi:hypothetical protein
MNKIFKLCMAVFFAMAIFSCNNSADTAKEPAKDTTKATDTVAAKPAPPPPPAFMPADVLEVTHTVKDYATWRAGFNSDSTLRKENGMMDMVVGRSIDNPNKLMVVMDVTDMEKAKAFGASPKLKEEMKKHGVISKPDMLIIHTIRFNPDSKEKQWVVITHKVKDFAVWLKAFDGEGTAARASQGLFDVALGRSVADSSIVQIVFDIKDMAKAKASIMSEEKKKLMMSAGVLGVPKIQFYTTGE